MYGCTITTITQALNNIRADMAGAFFIAVVGFVGNTTTVINFLRNNQKVNFHRLVIVLSVCDNVSIIMILSMIILPYLMTSEENIYQIVENKNQMIPFCYPILELAMTCSIYFTLAINIERYLIVCHPFYTFSRQWSFKTYMLIISNFCVIYNLPRWFELKTVQCQNGKIDTSKLCSNETYSWRRSIVNEMVLIHNCSLRNSMLTFTDLGCSSYYLLIYRMVLDLICKCIFPFLLLIIANGLIVKNIYGQRNSHSHGPVNQRQRKVHIRRNIDDNVPNSSAKTSMMVNKQEDVKLAKTSMVISAIFVLCYSAIWIPKLSEYINKSKTDMCKWEKGLIRGYVFIIVNSSIKCYAYFFARFNPIQYLKSLYRRKTSKPPSTHVTLQTGLENLPLENINISL